MLKIGAMLAATFAIAWFAIPNVRTTLVWAAPFAVFLICPLALLLGGYGMHRVSRVDAKRHPDCCAGHHGSNAEKEKEKETVK